MNAHPGRAQDDAFMESFFKTREAEEVWLEDCENAERARERIGAFVATTTATECTRP